MKVELSVWTNVWRLGVVLLLSCSLFFSKTAKLPSAEKQAVGWSVPQHMPNLKYAHDSWWDIKCQSSVVLNQRVGRQFSEFGQSNPRWCGENTPPVLMVKSPYWWLNHLKSLVMLKSHENIQWFIYIHETVPFISRYLAKENKILAG